MPTACIGYHLASGTTEEWMMWGGNENEWVDYSPVNLAGLSPWLQAQYGTDQRLQAAWADPAVTFETAAIPTKAQRQATHLGCAARSGQGAAGRSTSTCTTRTWSPTRSGYFAKAVKDITRGEKIVGVFYGYMLQLCGEQRQQNAGHLGLAQVLASPDVDFLCSPTSYAFRQLGGEGTSHFMSLLGSVQMHGKLWFDENDIRTSLVRREGRRMGPAGQRRGRSSSSRTRNWPTVLVQRHGPVVVRRGRQPLQRPGADEADRRTDGQCTRCSGWTAARSTKSPWWSMRRACATCGRAIRWGLGSWWSSCPRCSASGRRSGTTWCPTCRRSATARSSSL